MTASGREQLTLLIRTSVPFRWIATNTSFANAAAVGFSTNIRSKGVPSTAMWDWKWQTQVSPTRALSVA
jgi:hypothetical protein